jgi:hypothetical protein
MSGRRIYIDVPVSFAVASYHDHDEARDTYQRIISAAVRLDFEIKMFRARPLAERQYRLEFGDGIYYAYHARTDGPDSYCIKASALPGLWYFDESGYSGWCKLANDKGLQEQSARFDLKRADDKIAYFKSKFLNENLSRHRQSDAELDAHIRALDDYIFYPLQVNSDEVLKLGRFGQFEVLSALAKMSEQYRRHVVVKRHPLCDSALVDELLRELADHPFIHVSEGSIHKLIPASRAVLVSNSGVGLQALIHGKTVYSLARSEYAHMTTAVMDLEGLEAVLQQPSVPQTESVRRQLGYLIDEYWVDTSRELEILQRMRTHVARFDARRGATLVEAADAVSSAGDRVSILHRVEKELNDLIDLMVLMYPTLALDQKERIATSLARAVKKGLKADLILRRTDSIVWRKCLSHFTRIGDLETAERIARAIVEEDSTSCQAHLTLGKILFSRGLDQQGFKAAKRAADSPSPTAEALTFFGRKLLSRSGSRNGRTAALSCAERALEIESNWADAHWLKARILLIENELEPALSAASLAMKCEPDNPRFTRLHRQILSRLS